MKSKRKAILVLFLIGLGVWLLHHVYEFFMFGKSNFWRPLFVDISNPRIVMRIGNLLAIIIFGVLIYLIIAKPWIIKNREEKHSHDDLRKQHVQRVKSLNCLLSFFTLVDRKDIALDQIFQDCVVLIPRAYQFSEITCARLRIYDQSYETENFRSSPWHQSAAIETNDKVIGNLEVCYLQQCPQADEGPFLAEESELIISLARRFSHLAQRDESFQRITKNQIQLRSLASKLTLAQAHERRRVAQQVHDDIIQNLALSMLKLNNLQEAAVSDKTSAELQNVIELIKEVVQRTRSLIYDLSSPVLHRYGLEKAVTEWAQSELLEKHGIQAKVLDDEQHKPLSNDIRELLFQSIKELLVNIIKHAHAKTVEVSFQRSLQNIEVIVQDDGIGLKNDDIGMFDNKGGFGIFSIQQRLDYLGGRLDICSKPGHGTKVTLVAPLAEDEKKHDTST